MTVPAPELIRFLARAGLAEDGETGQWKALTGGVSSDIWHVRLRSGDYCIKRALAQLKTAAEWKAPVERNATEWAYMQVASTIHPGAVPKPIAQDQAAGLFAMEWLPPDTHALWKSELLEGRVDLGFAASVGRLLGEIHAATADDEALARRFDTGEAFHALRLEPYLLTTASVHPQVAGALRQIVARTASTRRVLVHGDVSPKNILIGPGGPVLLDAEVAWFGDPAFDLAFCLNHLAIKARIVADAREGFVQAFEALRSAYLAKVSWEAAAELEQRAAALLPALALARIDGKSPVEYLEPHQRDGLRHAALKAMTDARTDLRPMLQCVLG